MIDGQLGTEKRAAVLLEEAEGYRNGVLFCQLAQFVYHTALTGNSNRHVMSGCKIETVKALKKGFSKDHGICLACTFSKCIGKNRLVIFDVSIDKTGSRKRAFHSHHPHKL